VTTASSLPVVHTHTGMDRLSWPAWPAGSVHTHTGMDRLSWPAWPLAGSELIEQLPYINVNNDTGLLSHIDIKQSPCDVID